MKINIINNKLPLKIKDANKIFAKAENNPFIMRLKRHATYFDFKMHQRHKEFLASVIFNNEGNIVGGCVCCKYDIKVSDKVNVIGRVDVFVDEAYNYENISNQLVEEWWKYAQQYYSVTAKTKLDKIFLMHFNKVNFNSETLIKYVRDYRTFFKNCRTENGINVCDYNPKLIYDYN